MKIRFYSGVPEIGAVTVACSGGVDLVSFGVTPGPIAAWVPCERHDTHRSVFLAAGALETPYLFGGCPLFWDGMEVPVGKVKVVRHAYRVRDDGCGGSFATRGRRQTATVDILRNRDDSLTDAVRGTIARTAPGEDFGTLESYSGGTTWGTIPFRDFSVSEKSERLHGDAYVSHVVFFSGEIIENMDKLAEQFKESYVSW